MFDMFSGGALGRMTIFALNIMPYITASIIMQLMTAIVPSLETLKKDGEAGRKMINQYTRYLTVLLATVQGYGIAVGLEAASGVVNDPGLFFRVTTVVTLVGGTLFLLWLGEQITSRGVGNGISLIIFAGIVANLPTALAGTLELGDWRIVIFIDRLTFDNGGCGRSIYCIYREVSTKDFGTVSKAPARKQSVWWGSVIFTFEDKRAGRYTPHFRVVAIADAGFDY